MRHYWRSVDGTRDQLRIEYVQNNVERIRLAYGAFYLWQAGPRLPLVGELGNNLANYTSPFPVRAADALNQPNTFDTLDTRSR